MEEPLDEVSVPAEHVSDTPLPLFGISVQAGLPTPAEPTVPQGEDVERMLIGKPESTFFIRMKGDALRDYGVFDGDILVTDRSLAAGNGDLAVIKTHRGLFARAISVLDGRIAGAPHERESHALWRHHGSRKAAPERDEGLNAGRKEQEQRSDRDPAGPARDAF